MEREIRGKKITWRLNNMLQEKGGINNEIKEEIKKKTLKQMTKKHTTIQILGDAAKAVL